MKPRNNATRVRALLRAIVMGKPRDRTRELMEDGTLVLGRRTYDPPLVAIYPGDETKVRIGAFCSIAADVQFMPGGNHRVDTVTSFPLRISYDLPGAYHDGQPWSKGDVIVGNDVWIGRGARILGGLTIGDGAVVGGHAVVTRSVEPYSIVAGNSAKHIRYRFSAEQITRLREIAWWDWADDLIVSRVDDLASSDIDGFITKYGRHSRRNATVL